MKQVVKTKFDLAILLQNHDYQRYSCVYHALEYFKKQEIINMCLEAGLNIYKERN